MKACILLSGLQRNFKPFIANQLRCVIHKYKLDVFIYTSDENVLRYSKSDSDSDSDHTHTVIDYKTAPSFETGIDFFRNAYSSYVKGIYIDHNNEQFTEYLKQHNIKKHRNHTVNMISSYFKINGAISLMEEYEKQRGFRYDIVMRCRLDFYSCDDSFVDPYKINLDTVYFPISKFNHHKDDGGFIMRREFIPYFKVFIQVIASFDDTSGYIIIEDKLHYYMKHRHKVAYIPNFAYRIGLGCRPSTIPYIQNLELLNSLEYHNELQ